MAYSLAYADESSALPKGTLKETRAALDAFFKNRDPKEHKAHKKQMARRATGYIENAPLEVLLRVALRRDHGREGKGGRPGSQAQPTGQAEGVSLNSCRCTLFAGSGG